MNPIEMLWSKVKALLRKWKCRTAELLPKTVSCALLCVSQRDSSAGLRSMDIACNFGNCYNPKYQNVSASNLRVTMELGLIVLGCIRHLRIRGAEIRGGHSMTILT